MKPSLHVPITWLIRGYQRGISPLLPRSCRFYPSCSQYMLEAVERFGAAKGVALGIGRIGRCHPWHPGGFDPVPLLPEEEEIQSHKPVASDDASLVSSESSSDGE